LLGLGSRVTPERRLRVVARRPLAELAAATGAAVSLSATIGGEMVYLDTMDARVPLGPAMPEAGSRVPPGTAPARAHILWLQPFPDARFDTGARADMRHAPIVDARGGLPDISCVAVAVPLGGGDVAAVTTLVAGQRPSLGLMAATRAVGARIDGLLRDAGGPQSP
jgi:DNA-binding IclR family transcriptional regulator